MDVPKLQVDCTVDNCKFNRDHLCHAPSLKIDAMGSHHAYSSESTCCSTFISQH